MILINKISFVGIQGIPAKYGGFETAVEQISLILGKQLEITIFCSSKIYKQKPFSLKKINNIKLIYLPVVPISSLDKVFRELIGITISLLNGSDVIHFFGPSFVYFLPKLFRKQTIITLDGFEWQRNSYSIITKVIVLCLTKFDCLYNKKTVVDNIPVRNWISKIWKRQTYQIGYGATTLKLNKTELKGIKHLPESYFLFVGRFVKEKGVDYLIDEFKSSNINENLVLMGFDPFGGQFLKEMKTKSEDDKRIIILDSEYGKNFHIILKKSKAFITGSLSEGMSPAILSAMGYGIPVILPLNEQNKRTTKSSGIFYDKKKDSLRNLLNSITEQQLKENSFKSLKIVEKYYNWKNISKKYVNLYCK